MVQNLCLSLRYEVHCCLELTSGWTCSLHARRVTKRSKAGWFGSSTSMGGQKSEFLRKEKGWLTWLQLSKSSSSRRGITPSRCTAGEAPFPSHSQPSARLSFSPVWLLVGQLSFVSQWAASMKKEEMQGKDTEKGKSACLWPQNWLFNPWKCFDRWARVRIRTDFVRAVLCNVCWLLVSSDVSFKEFLKSLSLRSMVCILAICSIMHFQVLLKQKDPGVSALLEFFGHGDLAVACVHC